MNVRTTMLSAGLALVIAMLWVPQVEAATETVVYAFKGGHDGSFPSGGLLEVNGSLYGVTPLGGTGNCQGGCGTVFSFDPATGAETVIYSFQGNGVDGSQPAGTLIDVNNTLYGVTTFGGTGTCSSGCGTVFSINPNSGAETVVYSFQHNGLDPQWPSSGLINENGMLYGASTLGGANCLSAGSGCGTIFSLDPTTGSEAVLYSFCTKGNCADGVLPNGPLLNVNGTFYGTTEFGGLSNTACIGDYPGCGTVFSFDPGSGAETVLYSFCSKKKCADGSEPAATLLEFKNAIYGTTSEGGNEIACDAEGCGTIFSLDLISGAETAVYVFCQTQKREGDICNRGAQPNGGLIELKDKLVGTSVNGGKRSYGNVFSIRPSTAKVRQLHAFADGADGAYPAGSLVDFEGTLYGTTRVGGRRGHACALDEGCGTVFSIAP
ncbi:MAG TPA: choice-of-anchor tandem repeat GloVer-containing protein [Rhizomicrobium sp.]|nr:choice-of-anchor tandem repeat GloVer-containing protein [Rhizomicrobium sp.]